MKPFVGLGIFLALLGSSGAAAGPLSPLWTKEKPKLVLVLVIDQFRADYLTRFADRFLPPRRSNAEVGGFEYLKSQGAYYPQANYDVLQSMTGPGHSMILSGTYPYQSGISLNTWYDVEKGQSVYCAEDGSVETVEAKPKKRGVGTSPRNSLATTVGDELKNAGYPSRVVAIALKDRASIFLGGHRADGAFWMDAENFEWASSKFYFPDGKLPAWVKTLNESLAKQKGKKTTWNAEGASSGLSLADAMPLLNAEAKEIEKGFGLKFPHSIDTSKRAALDSPFGIDVTEEAAERAIDVYNLGKGKAPDVLAVSFSSHDYVAHRFGLNSREMEEMTVHEDRALAKLLNYVQKKVPGGLKQTLIVLTADHGAPSNPDWLVKERVAAGRLDEDQMGEQLEKALRERFGDPKTGAWVAHVKELNFYLSPKAFEGREADRAKVEAAATDWLRRAPGIAHAFSLSDYRARTLPPGQHERQILKTYYPGRSGDVVAIPKPFFMSGDITVMHMTGYKYDTNVPVILAGPHVQPGVYGQPADVVDIAPTLSFLLGTVPPALSEGRVLVEALR